MNDKDVSGRMKRETLETMADDLLVRMESTMRELMDYASKLMQIGPLKKNGLIQVPYLS